MGRNVKVGFNIDKRFNFAKRIKVPKAPVEVKASLNNRINKNGIKERKCIICGEWKELNRFVIRYYLPIGKCLDCNTKK